MEKVEDDFVLEGSNFITSMGKLKADASDIVVYTRQLRELLKNIDKDEANIKKRSRELDSKEKELLTLSSDLDKRSELFQAEKTKAGNLSKLVEDCSQELSSKKNELNVTLEELELKDKELGQAKAELERCFNEAREVQVRKREVEGETARKTKDLGLILVKIGETDQQLEKTSREVELKKKELQILSLELEKRGKCFGVEDTKANDLMKLVEESTQELRLKDHELIVKMDSLKKVQRELELKDKELAQVKAELRRFSNETHEAQERKKEVEDETARKTKDLGLILVKIGEYNNQLEKTSREVESKKKELQILSLDLEKRGLCFEEEKGKADGLRKKQKLIEEETKKLCDMQKEQPSAAPVNDTRQQNAPEAELVDEDVLTHYESSASLVHDVSSALRASPNPAEIVLDLVQDAITKTSGLEDSAVEILVHLLDEFIKIQQLDQLANIQRPGQYQLQVKATEFATLWKRKITIKAPKSSLEALAFLQFIVAYELKTMINQKETVLLASSIAQYEQASTLFNALGLNAEMIPDIVMELIKKSYYIPAVRFICKFKLNEKFQPSDLLKKEITNLRQSLLKKGPTRCSQAQGKKGRKLRAILEVLADYEELKNDLPGDLIAELMIQRENSISVTHLNLRVPKTELNPS